MYKPHVEFPDSVSGVKSNLVDWGLCGTAMQRGVICSVTHLDFLKKAGKSIYEYGQPCNAMLVDPVIDWGFCGRSAAAVCNWKDDWLDSIWLDSDSARDPLTPVLTSPMDNVQNHHHQSSSLLIIITRPRPDIDRVNFKVQGVFFLHWYPPKKLKYGKPRLREST